MKSEFGTPIEKKKDEETARTLRQLIYPFILRRTKDLVAPELPPRSDRVLYCDMEPAQRHLYNRTRDGYRGVLLGMLEKDGIHANRMKILEGLLRLRQISIHPLLVDEKFRGESGKRTEGVIKSAPMSFKSGTRINVARSSILLGNKVDRDFFGKEFIVPVIEIIHFYWELSAGG